MKGWTVVLLFLAMEGAVSGMAVAKSHAVEANTQKTGAAGVISHLLNIVKDARAHKVHSKTHGGTMLEEDKEEEEKNRKMYMFLLAVVVAIIITGIIAYKMANENEKRHNNRELPLDEFLGYKGFDPLLVAVGMASGLVFGFIDNAGLFFGMEYLDPLLSKLPMGNEALMNAGYGNTFSDMVGAFMGTFAGRVIEEAAKKNNPELGDYPIWTEAIGITLGCIIGVLVPRMIVSPTKQVVDQDTIDALKAGVDQALIDRVTSEFKRLDEQFDIERKGEVRLENLIKNLAHKDLLPILKDADLNGDGWVTLEEVLKQLKIAQDNVNKMQKSQGPLTPH